MVVNWTIPAIRDLDDFKSNSKMSPENLKEYALDLTSYVEELSSSPHLGAFLFTIEGLELRQLIYKKHRIIYTIKNETIFVIAVVHISRNFDDFIKELLNLI